MEMPNSLGNVAWGYQILQGILHGDAKFSREFRMGCRIPCSVGDTKNTDGVPKSLGDLTRGCQIPGSACRIPYVIGNLASPVFGTPTQNTLAILEPPSKIR